MSLRIYAHATDSLCFCDHCIICLFLFLEKVYREYSFSNSKFALNENSEILPQNIKIAKLFNSYFELITDSQLFDWTFQLNISDDKEQNVS